MPMPGEWNFPEITPWKPHFALVPVRCIDGRRAWLKRIYKRRISPPLPWLDVEYTQYAHADTLVQSVLEDE